jgi:hypothetical protein
MQVERHTGSILVPLGAMLPEDLEKVNKLSGIHLISYGDVRVAGAFAELHVYEIHAMYDDKTNELKLFRSFQ